jgi:UDP-N-acetylglucosamine diphosphorylase / glucose-1-phosphate thymidylyltransferase / UDP-N-acetylgalactosamine diphosphorylase / glucosamine-1-phosphate N-acetyltransferase / galactosamine-1-phosphate N-acetyltransferase
LISCEQGELPYFETMFEPADLFDLSKTEHSRLFHGCEYAWEALGKIGSYVQAHARPELRNRCLGAAYIGEQVVVGEGTVVEDGVMIKGPAIIGRNCQIRHNAYIREAVLVGDNCVVGNASELKNCLLFNEVQVPHFNYVGDSILGHKVHLGAGVILSNYRIVPGNVAVEVEGQRLDTGLRKFGALLGDGTELGCNVVLNPGSILGRNSVVYPSVSWRGVLPPNMIVKSEARYEVVVRRPRSV